MQQIIEIINRARLDDKFVWGTLLIKLIIVYFIHTRRVQVDVFHEWFYCVFFCFYLLPTTDIDHNFYEIGVNYKIRHRSPWKDGYANYVENGSNESTQPSRYYNGNTKNISSYNYFIIIFVYYSVWWWIFIFVHNSPLEESVSEQ